MNKTSCSPSATEYNNLRKPQGYFPHPISINKQTDITTLKVAHDTYEVLQHIMNKILHAAAAIILSTLTLSSCEGFMQGLASGMGGYGGYGGYYAAPSYNTVSAPAATFSAPTFDYSNTWNTAPVYTAPTTVSSGSSTYSSGSSTSTSGSSSSSDRSCRVCYGLGKCRTCNGNGQYFDTFTSKYIKCPNCTNGLCTSCGGSGRK